jgi:type IV secretory pathway VirB3-like protein
MLEPIYKAATRKQLKWGIPIRAGLYVIFVAWQVGMWGARWFDNWLVALAATVAGIAVLAWMRWATREDDQRIDQLIDAFWLWWLHLRSERTFGCHSYGALVNDGESDAWLG